jgi:hypothetical protein
MPILKAFQSRNQPTGGEGRDGGDIDTRAVDGLSHHIETVPFQSIQNFAHLNGVSAATRSKPYPIANALK